MEKNKLASSETHLLVSARVAWGGVVASGFTRPWASVRAHTCPLANGKTAPFTLLAKPALGIFANQSFLVLPFFSAKQFSRLLSFCYIGRG